jgi:hypothetical protein
MDIVQPVLGLASGAPRGRRRLAAIATVAVLLVGTLLLPLPALSNSFGIVGRTRGGCSCHNMTGSTEVVPSISGLPGFYDPGTHYQLVLSFDGGPPSPGQAVAGFDLAASAGTLQVPEGLDQVRVDPATGEATHTTEGRVDHSWRVVWRAPSSGTGDVTFTLVVNAVNGDGVQGPQDQWGRTEVTVQEGGRGGIRDAPLFWSVVGAAAVIAIIAVAYMSTRGPRMELRR